MDPTGQSAPPKNRDNADQYAAEVKYHLTLRPLLVIAALPSFIFFAVYHFVHGNRFPGIIFTLLAVNALVGLVWARHMTDIKKLARLNNVGMTIAFVLLGIVLAAGLLSIDIYIVIPWVLIYPAVILLMMGERTGIIGAVVFTVVIITILILVHLPAWSASSQQTFKINMAFALIALLVYTLLAERSRVKMRNSLLKARNKYKASEERQRTTNEELKNEIQMRIQSENALSQSEIRYRALFEESSVSLWEEDLSDIKNYLDELPQEAIDDLENYLEQHRDEVIKHIIAIHTTAVNRATLELYEASNMQELLTNLKLILPQDMIGWQIKRVSEFYKKGCSRSQVEPQTVNGRRLNVLVSSTIPAGFEASWERVYTSVYDITERVAMEQEKKRFEQQLQHTRQFQAIGSLAGGIAHQFNNALAVISGSVDLLEIKIQDVPETTPQFSALRGSSERMRRLTEQLLAYARGGKYQPTDFSVEELITTILTSEKELKTSTTQFTTVFEDSIVLSRCDLTQIRIVLEAVLYNAVEAMQNKGEVIIATQKVRLTKSHGAVAAGLTTGHYAQITITDKGIGMDEETCRRIFEPFFTTKFVGRGLGMAAAYGIVRNHDGLIQVASTPDVGTQVNIYLPCAISA